MAKNLLFENLTLITSHHIFWLQIRWVGFALCVCAVSSYFCYVGKTRSLRTCDASFPFIHSFIHFFYTAHDHNSMVWSTYIITIQYKTRASGMIQVQQVILKHHRYYLNKGGTFFKKAPNLQITFGLSDCSNKINFSIDGQFK